MRKGLVILLILSLFLFQMFSMVPVPAVPLKYDNGTVVSSVDASYVHEVPGENAGTSVAIVGDVNRDGYDDILIGAKNYAGPGSNSGKVYLILGNATGWGQGLNLSNANASWIGEHGLDWAGFSVAGAGDVNDDGYDDMLIGAYWSSEAGSQAGEAYLIFGRATGWALDVNLSNADASFRGSMVGALAGNEVAGAGDVNGDGFDDFLIAADVMHHAGKSLGEVYLFFGRQGGWLTNQDIGTASNASFLGEVTYDYLGNSVAGAGDVNGDGYDDILMGSLNNAESGYAAGQVYLVLGKATGWSKDQNVSTVADASFLGVGINDTAGMDIDGAGDVNGDGYDDIIIGAYYNSEVALRSGKAYLVLGRATGWAKDMDLGTKANASYRGELAESNAGHAVAMAGDVNGDGLDDILVGSPTYKDGTFYVGKTYLMLGKQSGYAANVSLIQADASFKGEPGISSYVGASIGGGGDVNGDGMDDFVIGAPEYNSSSGIVYVVSAMAGTPPATISSVMIKDHDFTSALLEADMGDIVGIELFGTPENAWRQDIAYVQVKTDTDANGYKMKLYETTNTSGTYRGLLSLKGHTNPRDGWIGARMGDQLTVTSMTDQSKVDTIPIKVHAQLLMPKADETNATEDVTYMEAYWNEGLNPVSSWTFDTNASFLRLDAMGNDRVLIGTPNNTHVGSSWVRINITDGLGHFDEHNFTVTVANTPPNITTNDTNTTIQNQPYLVDYNSTDDGQGNITWHLMTDAKWLRMNATTGVLNGTPTWNDTGMFSVNVSVSDGHGGWCNRSFNLTVANINDAPIVFNDDVNVTYEDEKYHVVYSALDPDPGDMVTWSFSSNASWLNFDFTNKWLEGTPTNDQVGEYWVNVTVKDLSDARTVRNFTLTVLNVNDLPEVRSGPVSIGEVLYEYRYQVVATDIDKGDVLSYSLDAAPIYMTIGNTTGLVTWRPTRAQAGDHRIVINVSDGNASVVQEYTLTVTIPPFFIPVSTLLFPENDTIVDVKNPALGWSAEDPDSDSIYYDVYLSTERDEVATMSPSALVAEDISEQAFVPSLPLGRGNIYYWTVIPNDEAHGGKCSSGIWEFKVSLAAGMSTEPLAFLISPVNGTRMDDIPVPLVWSGVSFGTDTLSFDVYISTDEQLVRANDAFTRIEEGLLNWSTIFKDAERGLTYYWTVVPKEGSTVGRSLFGVWSFSTSTTARVNHWPVINSKPPSQVYVNETFTYFVNASDVDMDELVYTLAIWPDGMVLDPWTGLVLWTPDASQVGDQEVLIWVSDDFLTAEQDFMVTVQSSATKDRPPVFSTSPLLEAYVDQEWSYTFLAYDPDDDVLTYSLERFPEGAKFDALHRKITFMPDEDMVGNVSFSLKVSDGYEPVYQNFTVTVKEVGGDPQTYILPFFIFGILALAIFIGIIGAVFLYGKNRGEEKKRKERDREMAVRVEAARVSGMEEGAAAAAISASHHRASAVAVPADDEVEPFEINDVFLIYRDGRLIAHSRTKENESLDKDVMSSMLVAIQGFVKESFQDGLTSFECSNKKVVMVAGNYLILVAVVDGTEPKVLRDEMQAVMTKIEGLYSGIVENWDGNTERFKDVRPYMLPLFTLDRRLRIKKTAGAVKVKSGIEFFGGYVRLKVGVSNGLANPITLVALTLTYDTMSLSLSHIEPEYPLQGSKIFLNDIKPNEKRSVAVYFDPVICQESSIEGLVTYFDANGAQGSAQMKTRPVDIVCPIFYTKENINVAMLRRLIPELKYNDSKVYQISEVQNLKAAYKVALGCVQAHDVKEVREYGRDSPYEAEMWYYGEVKGTDEQMVIRVSVREWQHYLSIFVASRNLATMTGLLAEIGKDFGRAMAEWTEKGTMSTLVDEAVKVEIARTRSLLEKETDAEASPAESDTKGPVEKGSGQA